MAGTRHRHIPVLGLLGSSNEKMSIRVSVTARRCQRIGCYFQLPKNYGKLEASGAFPHRGHPACLVDFPGAPPLATSTCVPFLSVRSRTTSPSTVIPCQSSGQTPVHPWPCPGRGRAQAVSIGCGPGGWVCVHVLCRPHRSVSNQPASRGARGSAGDRGGCPPSLRVATNVAALPGAR